MSTRRLVVLDTLSVIGLIAAAIIAILPGRMQLINATGIGARSKVDVTIPPATSSADNSRAATIVAANILSGSRRAPTLHYKSPEAEEMQAFAAPVAALKPDAAATDSAGNSDAIPGLYGIVNVDGTWRALLRLSDSDASPTLLKEGDRRGGYRVLSIQSDRVVLAGTAGQRTLRLARNAPGDSTGSTGKRP
ncbi:MAG: hypothetical protein ABJB66_09895 [Gemmatimonadaceae bacterium]